MIATSAVASGTISAPASSSSSSRLMVQGTKERFNKNGMFVDESLSSSISSSVSSGTYSSKGEIKKDYEVKDRIDDAPPLVDIEPKHQHHQYTWEELSKYFGISLKEAATMLKIHPTQLKRITEASGITKWPYQGVKKISEYRKLEQISEINSIEEMKFGNTVIEETIEFGLRNTATRVPISVKLAEFKGAKYRRKFVMPPMTPMVMIYCISTKLSLLILFSNLLLQT